MSIIIGIKQSATASDKTTLNGMINSELDPQYDITTMGKLWKKKGSPDALYLLGDWDVDGRKFPFKADNSTAWINSHSRDFDAPNDVIVLKKFDLKLWSPVNEYRDGLGTVRIKK